ncbi:MAG TPA: hypothetical protein VNN22_23665 [Verrucomicrobiae bacterium]|nr:hypothetical protein [Verrucomicrobiae bacterium]
MTKNKWYRALGFVMVPLGLFLTISALVEQGRPVGAIPWVKLGPFGLMSVVGGVGLLFLPDKIKFK